MMAGEKARLEGLAGRPFGEQSVQRGAFQAVPVESLGNHAVEQRDQHDQGDDDSSDADGVENPGSALPGRKPAVVVLFEYDCHYSYTSRKRATRNWLSRFINRVMTNRVMPTANKAWN